MSFISKKKIQNFWTENVPGLDLVSEKYSPEQREFYTEVDEFRYRYDSYIVPLLDSFAEKGKLILEIGCGMGTDSRHISRRQADIVSLDLSFNNVDFTLKGMHLLNLTGMGVCADAENLPFKDNAFDVVYSFGVLHHTPDTQKAINEIYRVLKPNGKCVTMLYHKGYAYYVLLMLHGYKRLLGIYDQDRLMSKYDKTPLSRLYSRREINVMFRGFRDIDISITTFGAIQAHPILKYIHFLFNKSKFLMQHFGSFIIIKSKK